MKTAPDVFSEAREKYRVPELWIALGLPGDPKASCKSPFREDRSPSFSIFDDGRAWTDHATGDGGDVIEFLRVALGIDHRAARDWFGERLGIDHHDGPVRHRQVKPSTTAPAKKIQWPCDLVEGTPETWEAFARLRGYAYPSVHTMIHAGLLRFAKIDGVKCYVITDPSGRAAEIRRLDGKAFGDCKAFPLKGVDKSWPLGAYYLDERHAHQHILICEGATDFLAAIDMQTRYVKSGGLISWQPLAILGANCRNLDPELIRLIRGRHCRLVPDADDAGDKMRHHWTALLNRIGCSVDCVELPRGTDLSDNLTLIEPSALFSPPQDV